jgi:hypothetical protein
VNNTEKFCIELCKTIRFLKESNISISWRIVVEHLGIDSEKMYSNMLNLKILNKDLHNRFSLILGPSPKLERARNQIDNSLK